MTDITRGRPRIVSTEEVVRALAASRTLREAADRLGVWHGAILNRKEPEILEARRRMKAARTRALRGGI